MSDDPRTRAEQLTAALTDGHERLYMTSPTFHGAVDTLVQLLPIWLDGIAVEAQAADARAAEAVELAKRLFPGPMWLSAEAVRQMGDDVLRKPAHGHDPGPIGWPHVYEPGPEDRCNITSCREPRESYQHAQTIVAVDVPGSETLADVGRAYVGRVTEEVRARQRAAGLGEPELVYVHVGENPPDNASHLPVEPALCGWPQDGHTPSPSWIDSDLKCRLPIRGYRAVSPENQTVTYSLPVCADHGVVATAAGWTVEPLPTPEAVHLAIHHAPQPEPVGPITVAIDPVTERPEATPVSLLDGDGRVIAASPDRPTAPVYDNGVALILEPHPYDVDEDGAACCPEPVDADVHSGAWSCICGPRNDDPGDPNPLCPLHGEPL